MLITACHGWSPWVVSRSVADVLQVLLVLALGAVGVVLLAWHYSRR